MDKNRILRELLELRNRLDHAIQEIQGEIANPSPIIDSASTPIIPKSSALAESSSKSMSVQSEASVGESRTSFLDILDLSDELQIVYVTVLKHDGLTMDAICELPELQSVEGVPVIVKTLARQGQLKKYMENNEVKYSSVTGRKGKKRISDDIWNVLED